MPDNIIEFVAAREDPKTNNLYVFGWPSNLGGADTKLDHTLRLVRDFMKITVIPNDCNQIKEERWTKEYESLGFNCITREQFIEMPDKLDGYAIALSNGSFTSGCTLCKLAKEKGLKVIWGSEMMWHFPGEIDCIKKELIDVVIYASNFNRECLEPRYLEANPSLESHVVGNYIDPKAFPFKERNNQQFTIGRLSRPDFEKYSADFPVFYESLGLDNPRYRTMAWDKNVANRYKWHSFGEEWDLLKKEEETSLDFLYSLDLFVYRLGHTFRESWGRSTVEAMLTGCIPVVPVGHNFNEFIVQGVTGFMCKTFSEFKNVCQELQNNVQMRKKIAKQASAYAASVICNEEKHREIWRRVFNAS